MNLKKFIKYFLYPLSIFNKNNYKNNYIQYNENIFKKLGFSINDIKTSLIENKIIYNDSRISWHYHIFAGLKFIYKKYNKINILEIGTYDGNFSNYLSKLFPNSEITTIDLDEKDIIFNKSIGIHDKENLERFINKRKVNIDRPNIKFLKINSFFLRQYFSNESFDLVWIDGDHLNPQVTIDIFNSLDLVKKNGYICVDDILKENAYNTKLASVESYHTVRNIEKLNLIDAYYIYKRVKDKKVNKFVSIIKVKK